MPPKLDHLPIPNLPFLLRFDIFVRAVPTTAGRIFAPCSRSVIVSLQFAISSGELAWVLGLEPALKSDQMGSKNTVIILGLALRAPETFVCM